MVTSFTQAKLPVGLACPAVTSASPLTWIDYRTEHRSRPVFTSAVSRRARRQFFLRDIEGSPSPVWSLSFLKYRCEWLRT